MYTGLIKLFVVCIIFLMVYRSNKKSFLQPIYILLRKKSFFHKAAFTHVRFYLKILLPHSWCWEAYKIKNYKKYPAFYAILNGVQFFGIIFFLLGIIVIQLGAITLSEVKKNGGVNAHGLLEQVKEPRLAKNGKYYPAELRILFDNQERMVFYLHKDFFLNDKINFKKIMAQQNKKVFIHYFTTLTNQRYLVSLKSEQNMVISAKKSMSAYQSQELSVRTIIWWFLIGCIAALWKYKLYGFKNYFNKLRVKK